MQIELAKIRIKLMYDRIDYIVFALI